MISRSKEGATLGLIPFVILFMTVIGLAWFYLAQFICGNKQLVNGTDAGAVAAARQMATVGLSSAEVSALPIEFQALGVDSTGTPTGVDPVTGIPNTANAIFNVFAFNRAAGYTLLVALNAAEDGSATGISNANTLITALNTFGTELNADLASAPQLTSTFTNLADANNTNMLGNNSSISLGNNDQLQFACVPGSGTGQANIYFNNAIYANDTTMQHWIGQITSGSPIASQINSRYNANDPSAQGGQPFVLGYQALDLNQITGQTLFTSPIYTAAVNPSQTPHMINQQRFNSAPAVSTAPTNAISATGQINTRNSLVCSALACAMLGAYDNQYPINMPYGWIRVQNGKDAIAANPNQSPALSAVPLWVDGSDTIFNNELYFGPGGGGGVHYTNAVGPYGAVFCTENYNNPNNPLDEGPLGYSGLAELQAWVNYTQTPCSNPANLDQWGHDTTLDPSLPQSTLGGAYVLGYASPTCNLRYSGTYAQLATTAQGRLITSILGYCNSLMYGSDTPTYCAEAVGGWTGNYFNASMPTSATQDTGTQPYGGLTNLEYIKGEVIGQFDTLWNQTGGGTAGNAWYNYSFNLNVPNLCSGSKVYDHTGVTEYSTPHYVNTVAFGTVSTPLALFGQLSSNQPASAPTNCADTSTSSTQWTDVTTPLGKLLERCQQIVPSTTSAQLVALLNAHTIDLNQYQYIYLPIGGSALAISTTPPPFLQNFPEYVNPGSTLPDGTTILSCASAAWDESGSGTNNSMNLNGSIINSNNPFENELNQYPDNLYGDANTHAQPFENWQGNISSYDAANWTSNSGRFYFLGQMSFGNYVTGNGSAFSSPN